jgi:NAD(P)-dependent dehydrogenase (short-subunit alcohol dehydrogenase family)
MPYSDLSGKVVILTGAARGIGAHLARAFAEQGMKVGALDQDSEKFAQLKQELGGTAVLPLKCDVSDARLARAQ